MSATGQNYTNDFPPAYDDSMQTRNNIQAPPAAYIPYAPAAHTNTTGGVYYAGAQNYMPQSSSHFQTPYRYHPNYFYGPNFNPPPPPVKKNTLAFVIFGILFSVYAVSFQP